MEVCYCPSIFLIMCDLSLSWEAHNCGLNTHHSPPLTLMLQPHWSPFFQALLVSSHYPFLLPVLSYLQVLALFYQSGFSLNITSLEMTFSSTESVVSTRLWLSYAIFARSLSLSSTFLILSLVCHLPPSIRIYSKRAETFTSVYICVTEDSVSITASEWMKSLSRVRLFATSWSVAYQAPLSWIFQVRVLDWVAISFSRGSSQPRDQTWVSHIVGRCFAIWATREIHITAT